MHRRLPKTRARQFLALVLRSLGQPQARAFSEIFFGMQCHRTPVLSEIARDVIALRKDSYRQLRKLTERWYRNIKSPLVDERLLRHDYLRVVEPWCRAERAPTASLDQTDIQKPGADKNKENCMEYVHEVYDGSTGNVGPGYEVMVAELTGSHGRRLPLVWDLYSAQEPGFNQHKVTSKAILTCKPYLPSSTVWAMDSGFDSRGARRTFGALGIHYVVRLDTTATKGLRRVWVDGHETRLVELVESLTPTNRFRLSRFGKKGRRIWRLSTGFVTAIQFERQRPSGKLSGHPESARYSLVVVRGAGKKPIALLTNLEVHSDAHARKITNHYWDRWGSEMAHRVVKTAFKLERVRCRKISALRRLVLISQFSYGFYCYLLKRDRKKTLAIVSLVAAFKKMPDSPFERMMTAIPILLGGVLKCGPP